MKRHLEQHQADESECKGKHAKTALQRYRGLLVEIAAAGNKARVFHAAEREFKTGDFGWVWTLPKGAR
jgi:hypothetical protein